MNLKKMLLSLITIMMFVVFVLASNIVYATTLQSGQEIYMGIIELMTNDTPNMGYAINKPGDANAAKIWNIVKYKSSTSSQYDDINIYCVKAGIGFTQTDNGIIKRAAYNVFYDMKTEREAIKTQNDILKDLVEKTITENGTTILLWLLFGSLLCGVGGFVALHILITNMNALAKAYNKQNGYSQSENNTSGSVSEPSNNNAQRVSSMQIPPVNKRTNSAAGYYGDDEQTTLLSQNVMEQTVRGILYFVHNQQSVTVDQDEFRIGKKADLVDYAINNSTSVSRQHAMITRRRGQFFLTDLGSTNGTFINNNRISGSVELQDGDNIRFADVICVFNIIE